MFLEAVQHGADSVRMVGKLHSNARWRPAVRGQEQHLAAGADSNRRLRLMTQPVDLRTILGATRYV
jgi:hypothetical protein